jgi:cyclopropane-fatty-acyl-phospholipid synthase
VTAPVRTGGVDAPSRAARETLAFLADVFGDYHPRDFAAVLWDGTKWAPETDPTFTLVLRKPWSLRSMFWPPRDTTLGEAYLRGDFEVEGDLTAALRLAEHLTSSGRRVGPRQLVRLLALPAPPRAQLERPAVVADHYDLSNDLFELFLDRRMQYSCASFASEDEELDAAQARKVDLVCRKLRLEPGERLLDIGCGWGGLIRHAASEYGVEALGVTISRKQHQLASERIREAGLVGRCRVELRDVRTLGDEDVFDKLVSVGMVEHVAPGDLLDYFRRAHRLLRPGGAFLLQGIAKPSRRSSKRVGAAFMTTYVFPEGELAPLPETLAAAERAGFEVRDVECLRESYELTTTHWRERLEARAEQARALVGEQAYRMLRIYLAGCAYNFARGNVTLYQTLLFKTDDGVSALPLTREDWYG